MLVIIEKDNKIFTCINDKLTMVSAVINEESVLLYAHETHQLFLTSPKIIESMQIIVPKIVNVKPLDISIKFVHNDGEIFIVKCTYGDWSIELSGIYNNELKIMEVDFVDYKLSIKSDNFALLNCILLVARLYYVTPTGVPQIDEETIKGSDEEL